MWIIILAAIVIIVLIIIVIVVVSQPAAPPQASAVPIDYATPEVAASAATPVQPVPAAGGSLTIVSGSYLPSVGVRATDADVARVSVDDVSPIVKAFRAIIPAISGGTRIDGGVIAKAITVANATRVPTRGEADVAYQKLITDAVATAAKPADIEKLKVEMDNAAQMARHAEKIRELISTGLLCGIGTKDAEILGCTLSPVSSPPCAAGWTQITTDYTRDSKSVPQRNFCVQNAKAGFSLVTGAQYPDPLRAGTVQTVKIGRK
jgi:hypothetical protein